MVSIRVAALAAATASLISTTTAANTTKPVLSSGLALPGPNPTLFGCYGSSQSMTWTGSYNYMTYSICQIYCINANKPVLATSAGTDCYCGDYAPPAAAVLTSDKCSTNCTGFGSQMCGGSNSTGGGVILSVYNDQLESAISNTPDSLTTSSSSATASRTASGSSPTSVQPAVITVTNAAGNVVSTSTPTSQSTSGGGSNTAGLVAGIVVGIIVVAAVGGGVWFFMRRKQRREVEEEHKRQVAQSSFIAGGMPESKTAQDSILDPAILRNRRESDGSIMDSQDYSRRVLRVTNNA